MSESTRKIDAVIHDLDGTLADSAAVNLETMAIVLGREPLTPDEIEHLRNTRTRDAMKDFGVKRRQLPGLLLRGRRLAGNSLDDIDVFGGIPEAIRQIDEEGRRQFVLSSNSPDNINGFLRRHDLDGVMEGVVGDVGMFAKAKRLTALVKEHGLVRERCAYVGDEDRDIDAGRKARVYCVAVAWGYKSPELLTSCRPDVLVTDPSELAEAISILGA